MIVGMMSTMRRGIPTWDLFETQDERDEDLPPSSRSELFETQDEKDEDLPPSSRSEPAQIGTRRQRQRCVQVGSGLQVQLKIND